MAVTITNEELDLLNKNGITDEDVRATVEKYRSEGLDDNAIRQKVEVKLQALGGAIVTPELKDKKGNVVTPQNEEFVGIKGQVKKKGFRPASFVKSLGKGFVHGVSSLGTGLGKNVVNPLREKVGKKPLTDYELENMYGSFLGLKEDGGAYNTGKVVGEIAPFMVLPEAKVAQLGTVGNATLTGAYQGALGSGLASVAEKGLDPKENLKDIAIGSVTGGALGGAIGKGGQIISRNQRAKELAKKQPQVTKEVKAEVVEQPTGQPTNVVPEQVQQSTLPASSEVKNRSLQQSLLASENTPQEVKNLLGEQPRTYNVIHNEDLVKQATKELEDNFDNELVRLASAKEFDALDYEKAHQIAQKLFENNDYQKAIDLIDNVSENATKKGQAIQALSLWSNVTPEGAVYKAQKVIKEYNSKHPKNPIKLTDENIDTIRKMQADALNYTDDLSRNQALARSAKYISELVPKNALQKLKAYRNISMLLNPKTLMRNTVGNAVFNTVDNISKAIASPIDSAIGLVTKQKTRVAPNLKTYGKGLLEGANTGYKEALEGIDTRGLGQRFDLGSGRTFQSKPMQALETALDIGLRTPDRAFYEATFAESVENMMKAQGLTKPTQEILEQAEKEALESVFQNQSKISDFALGLREGLNKIGTKDFGLGDVLIPYAQTPSNLTQQSINYSPLGLIKGGINLANGNQRQASLDFARSLVGTGLIGGGYALGKAGITTPSQFDESYTKNKTIRNNLQPLGIRPDQLGDYWYAPFQPISSPIATGTAMAYGKNPLFAGLNTVVDQPYLQGVTRGLRDLQEGNWTDAGVNVVSSIPSQFVPTLSGQLAQIADPYQRETYDPNRFKYGINQAVAKIPFASKLLPEKIDVTGQPIERYQTKGIRKLADILLNPTFENKKTTDPVLSELKYIYDDTKETSHFMPSVKKKLEFKDVNGIPQIKQLIGREYSDYQKQLGQRIYDEYDYVMDLPEYTNADEYGKIKLLENAKKLVKDEVENEMFNKRKTYKRKQSYTYNQ